MGRPRKKPLAEASEEVKKTETYSLPHRDIKTGLIEGLDYTYTEEGLINWKSLIPKKFLYVNNSAEKRAEIEKTYGKPYAEIDVVKDKVADKHLVIMLGGIKYLLRIRGYTSLKVKLCESNADYASARCEIKFIPNVETEGVERVFQEVASAHHNNTNSWYSKYLAEAACNRAFCRCVRNFLGVDIVSKEELGKDNAAQPNDDVEQKSDREQKLDILRSEMERKNLTWEQLKEKIQIAQNERGAYKELILETTNSINDLPNDIVFDITSKLKKQ